MKDARKKCTHLPLTSRKKPAVACNLMKVIPIIAAILGLAMIGALVGYFGAGAVVRSLRAIGWAGFSAICVIHLAVISLEGIAWRLLVPRAHAWAFIWGRLIRDAGSEVLPVSQMGGCVLGARAVALAGVPGSVAAATTMVDLTLEFVAKLAFMAIGLIVLVDLRPGMPVSLPVHPAIRLVQLPAVRARDARFELLDAAGAPLDDAFCHGRREALLAALHRHGDPIKVEEAFTVSRQQALAVR